MSTTTKPPVIVTGISGNLGTRLLRLLDDFQVVGIDFAAPRTNLPIKFEKIDLGREPACRQLVQVIKDTEARAIVHLAFVIDPLQAGILDLERMWQINVAGTARVMEAITEVNRQSGVKINTFIYPSSVSAYGPETPGPVKEDHPLGAHTLPYAVHKREADDVVRFRAASLGNCATYILRPHIFAGASMQNYLVGVLRGTPTGKSKRAARMRREHKRLPILIPGMRALENRIQVVHVDDVARLIAHILHRPAQKNELAILNVAGRGDPITLSAAAQIANAKIVNVRYRWIMRMILRLGWKLGLSGIPPEALPYMVGSYTMDTTRLKKFLGSDYERVIKYTITAALQDSLRDETPASDAASTA